MQKFDLPYFNNTDYPLAIKNQLDQLEYTDEISKHLRFSQHLPKEYYTRTGNVRGILLAHAMGQGKTRLAVAIAQHFREYDPNRKVIVLLPKSLEGNFKNNIKAYSKYIDDEYIDQNYKFLSLNASNMFKQVENAEKSQEEINYERRLGSFMDDIIIKNSLENSLLIIDEAHNLFNGITNGSKNAMALYDLIMKAYNLKLIFLTGTPIINDPFELVPCFNMLRGPMQVYIGSGNVNEDIVNEDIVNEDIVNEDIVNEDIVNEDIVNKSKVPFNRKSDDKHKSKVPFNRKSDDKHKPKVPFNRKSDDKHKSKVSFNIKSDDKRMTKLFSESREEFENFFIDRKNKRIKNKEKFSNRIFGLTSYYGDLYFPDKECKPGFPKKLETILEQIPMSQTQFSLYLSARIHEREESKKSFKGKSVRFSSSQGGSSTYRVKTRQISNFAIPEYALGPVRGIKSRQKFINRIKIDDLYNVGEFSPKMARILYNIQKRNDQPGMIYSQFVSGEGLGIFAKVLDVNGYENARNIVSDNGFDIKEKIKKKYVILSGDIPPNERTELIRKFNSPDNSDGSVIQLLLLSSAVAEGIDLKRIRHVHIMEPFWNYARIHQVETRAIRFESHIDLPLNQQNVQVYIYLSTYPINYPKNKIIEATTDMELYTKSLDNMEIINDFILVIAETSIDCNAHHSTVSDEVKKRIKCKLCSPNNTQLFHPLINKDMTLPSNCIPYSESKVSVNEIIIPESNETFYYKRDPNDGNIIIYLFNKKLNGYTPMPRTHIFYANIMEQILEQLK
jgi:hypothetical protein